MCTDKVGQVLKGHKLVSGIVDLGEGPNRKSEYTFMKNCPSSVSIIEDAYGDCERSEDCDPSVGPRSWKAGNPQPG